MNIFDRENNFCKYSNVNSVLLKGEEILSPDITIAVPTYKRGKYLSKTLESIRNQKTDYSIETIVVDNDPDQCLENVEDFFDDASFRLAYYKNEKNIGMFGNWNRCLELAHAKWVLILHDDDMIFENYVDIMLNATRKCDVGAITCNYAYMFGDNEDVNQDTYKTRFLSALGRNKVISLDMKDFYYRFPIKIFGVLINREKALSIGGFNEEFYPCGDEVFLLNICRDYKMAYVNKKMIKYRWAINESQKLNVRLDFVKYVDLFLKTLNSEYSFSNKNFEIWFRNAYANNVLLGIEKEHNHKFDEDFLASLKNELELPMNYKKSILCDFLILLHRLKKIIIGK